MIDHRVEGTRNTCSRIVLTPMLRQFSTLQSPDGIPMNLYVGSPMPPGGWALPGQMHNASLGRARPSVLPGPGTKKKANREKALTSYDVCSRVSPSAVPFERTPTHGDAMSDRWNELGSAELEVLKTLWDSGPCTVRDVLKQLQERGRRLAYTTVLTFLTRLEQKGFVTSNKSGLAYVYRAKVSRERVSRSRIRSLVEELYDGAAGALVMQLMQSERLTAEELDELQRLLDRLDQPEKSK